MSYKLVIVESPAKAKTIERYLGQDYRVASSYGHIRDLSRKELGVAIDDGFSPDYIIPKDKEKVVKELRSLQKNASEVILASDRDREGEAIAWHLCQALKLDPKTTKRIVFHEITDQALREAIDQPQTINQSLVDAQQARRILDRIVGFELSPVLWKKIGGGLSAGRVQSVAVRLINEREQEISSFKPKVSVVTKAIFTFGRHEVKAELDHQWPDIKAARQFLEACQKTEFSVADLKASQGQRQPGPPFKTSTLQQEASNLLGFGVSTTMSLAQKLYEAGHITYMRTDSFNLSKQSLTQAGKVIEKEHGQKYHQLRHYQAGGSAQEAHEAIRPTNFNHKVCGQDSRQKKLYDLIWRRTLASQMTGAKIAKTTVKVAVKDQPHHFIIKGERLEFPGFLAVYGQTKDDVILPEIKVGDKPELVQMTAQEKFSRPPARYSEASLVSQLEALKIGRPSTYAPTISTILKRGYVSKDEIAPKQRRCRGLILENSQVTDYDFEEPFGGSKNKLVPTPLAQLVVEFLCEHFNEIMDYQFTGRVEADFDRIAKDELGWQEQLNDFYGNFHPLIEQAGNIEKDKVVKKRAVGVDPKDGQTIYARLGRFGPMLQKGEASDQEKPLFAPLPEGQTVQSIELELALKAFELPRLVGLDDQKREVWAKVGPFGPYIQREETRASLKDKEVDPLTIDLKEAVEAVEAKEAADRERIIAEFGKISILNGRFGVYVTDGKKNASLPKDLDPHGVDEETAKQILAKAKPRRKKK